MSRAQVVVRVRPVLPHEDPDQVAVSCSPECDKVQVLLPDRSNTHKQPLPGANNRSGAKSYSFDACLPGRTTQAELFEICGMTELVEAALDGYSVTVFAFGQTGSGKTHTIIGPRLSRLAASGQQAVNNGAGPAHTQYSEAEDGLLPRCLDAAFRSISERSEGADFSVSTSCLELYNENVTDLLGRDRARQCQVRQDAAGSFKVDGLTEVPCSSAAAALKALSHALQYRHTRAHALNEYSSRSHCLMTFNFASQERPQEGGAQGAKGGLRRYGKLVLVDLAGSERLKESGSSGMLAVRETGSINRSLFTLGQVLAAQSTRSGTSHVPYRDSKLTSLLWEGLRGTGRALMLACLGPMKVHAEECLSTLHFASMATRIKAEPVVLMDPQDQLVLELRNTIRQLREDNKQLALAMSQLSSGGDAEAVFGCLPESLRLAAGRGSSGAGGQKAQKAGRLLHSSDAARPGSASSSSRVLGTERGSWEVGANDRGHKSGGVFGDATGDGVGVGRVDESLGASGQAWVEGEHGNSQGGFSSGFGGGVGGGGPSGSGQGSRPSVSSGTAAGGLSRSSSGNTLVASSSQATCSEGPSPAPSHHSHLSPREAADAVVSSTYTANAPAAAAPTHSNSAQHAAFLLPQHHHHHHQQQQQQHQQQHPPMGLPQQQWQLSPRASLAASSRLSRTERLLRTSVTASPTSPRTHSSVASAHSPRTSSTQGRPASSSRGGGGGSVGSVSRASNNSLAASGLGASGRLAHPAMGKSPSGVGASRPDPLQHAAAAYLSSSSSSPTKMKASNSRGASAQLSGHSARSRPRARASTAASQFGHGTGSSRQQQQQQQQQQQGGGREPAAQVQSKLQAFPELEAMEREFQQMLGTPAPENVPDLNLQPELHADDPLDNNHHRTLHQQQQQQGQPIVLHPPEQQQQQQQQSKQPDRKALSWAERNPWFGSDLQMTALAYQVHDELVGQHGMDASSDAYYSALEREVQQAYPQQWAHYQDQQALLSTTQTHTNASTTQASGGRSLPSPKRLPRGAQPQPRPFTGAGLKVHLKDPVPAAPTSPHPPVPATMRSPVGARLGAFQPVWHLTNSNRQGEAESEGLQQQPEGTGEQEGGEQRDSEQRDGVQGGGQQHQQEQQRGPAQHQPEQQQQQQWRQQDGTDAVQQSHQAEQPHSSAHSTRIHQDSSSLQRAPSELSPEEQAAANWSIPPPRPGSQHSDGFSSSSSSRNQAPESLSQRFQGSSKGRNSPLHSMAQHAPMRQRSSRASGAIRSVIPPSAIGTQLNSSMSLEEMQKEYTRQRTAVLAELQRAKSQAEEDRRKLLRRIGNQFSASRWSKQ